MYSQNKEEEFITAYFAESQPKRFLDIGAYDGKTFSNTLRLVEMGWAGVCLEPDPQPFLKLLETHKDNPQVICVNAGLGIDRGLKRFYQSGGDAISTTNEKHKDKWQRAHNVPYRSMFVNLITIYDIMGHFDKGFSFVNLDVEGTNWPLLQTLPLSDMGVSLLCVEYDDHKGDCLSYCAEHGLTDLLHCNGENIIVAKRGHR